MSNVISSHAFGILRGLRDAIKGRGRKSRVKCPRCDDGLYRLEHIKALNCLRCGWDSKRPEGEPGQLYPIIEAYDD